MKWATPNRAYHPSGYDKWTDEGRQAARTGKPRALPHRDTPYEFAYGFPAVCWFHGYDVEKATAPSEVGDEEAERNWEAQQDSLHLSEMVGDRDWDGPAVLETEEACDGEVYIGVRCRLALGHPGRCCSFGVE